MPRRKVAGLALRAVRLAAVLALATAAGCDMCEWGETRCVGHVAEECNSNGNWKTAYDCGTEECSTDPDVCRPIIYLGGEGWCCHTPSP